MPRATHALSRWRAISILSGALSASLVLGGTVEASPLPPDAADSETGEIVRVLDGPQEGTRLRTPAGEYVPVEGAGVEKIVPGSTVHVTAEPSQRLAGSQRRAAGPTDKPVSLESVKVLAAATTSYTAVTHQLTVAVATPAGASGTVPTPTQIRAQVQQAGAYWKDQSRGGIILAVASVSSPFAARSTCSDPFGLWSEAQAKTGFTQGADKHLVVVVPWNATNAGCSYGLGSVGSGVNAGGVVLVADTAWPVLAHELGHNLGLHHAGALSCPRTADVSLANLQGASCAVKEYGDPWDVMAASPPNNSGSLSMPQAYRIGLLGASEVAEARGGTTTVDLSPVATLTGTRLIKIVDPTTSQTYYIEYRARSGRDFLLYAPMTDGVRVIRESASSLATLALDASPTGRASDYTWGIPVGQSLRTYGGGVVINVASAGSSSARVSVTVGATPTAPTSTSSPSTKPSAAPAPPPTTSGGLVDLTTATGKVNSLGAAGWTQVNSPMYLFKTALVTYASGASWTVTVDGGATGRNFELLGTAFASGAKGRLFVDGRAWADFDSYRAGGATPYGQSLRTINVPAGKHTVSVVALLWGSRNTLALDAYRVR
ncbi:MAG: M12 family metallo-peptidase [Dermatophilaceae bacterium]